MNDLLAHARAIFHERPSEWSWRTLCHTLEDALDLPEHDLDVLVRYCNGHLSNWPDALRVSPRRWVERALDHGPHPLLTICRDITLPYVGVSHDAVSELLEHDTLARATTLRLEGDHFPAAPHPDVFLSALAHPAPSLHLDATRIDSEDLDEVFERMPGDRIARGGVTLRGHNLSSALSRHGAASISRLTIPDFETHGLFPFLCASPLITELDALDLSAIPLDATAARRLAESRIRPKELRIALAHGPSGDILFDGDDDEHGQLAAELLVDHDVFTNVHTLAVSNLDPRSARILSDALPNLTSLELVHTNAEHGHLLTSGHQLESLTLRGPHPDTLTDIDPSRLRTIDLFRTGTTTDDASFLARADALERVTLHHEPHLLEAMTHATLPKLTHLAFHYAEDSPELASVFERMVRAPWFPRLEQLVLSAATHSDATPLCVALSHADLSHLRSLFISNLELPGRMLRLAFASDMPHLQRLSLYGCTLPNGLSGVETRHVDALLELTVRRVQMTSRQLASRFDRGDLRELDTLRIERFDDGPSLSRVLRAAPGLRTFDAHACELDAACIKALRAGSTTDVALTYSKVDADALTGLLSSRKAARLDRLDLSFTSGADGVPLEQMLPAPGGPLSPRLLARAHVASRRDPYDD